MNETRKWILHRISAIILAPLYVWFYFSLILIFFWVIALSLGENNYEIFLFMMNSFLGKFILIGFTWSMSFHLLSGIRHLAWDFGYGFEIKTANFSGVVVIISSLVLTIIFWLLARGLI